MSYQLWDTPDWRLIHAGVILLHSKGHLELRMLKDDRVLGSIAWPQRNRPFFASAIENTELRQLIEKYSDIRALVFKTAIKIRIGRFSVHNEDDKTVLRLRCEQVAGTTVGQTIALEPLRGYKAAAGRLQQQLLQAGAINTSLPQHWALRALQHMGIAADSPSDKVNLDRDAPAIESCAVILQNCLQTIVATKPGIIADIDTEYLHDFRVAIRRTRSLLQLIPGVFDKDAIATHKQALKTLANETNAVRDLDVYVLQRETYRTMISASLRPGLEEIFEELTVRRCKAFVRLKAYLKSESAIDTINTWQKFVYYDYRTHSGPIADISTVRLARDLIHKRFQKIIRQGSKITPESPEQKLHDLRIEVKKMRYLLDFFRPLLQGPEVAGFVKGFRSLQTVLGSFNDYAVQESMIAQDLKAAQDCKKPSALRCAALGALVSALERKRKKVRVRFDRAFEELVSAGNRTTAKAMLKQ